MEELTDQALAEIQNLCKLGDEHAKGGRHSEALKAYRSAWALIPEPKTNWDAGQPSHGRHDSPLKASPSFPLW